MGACLAAAAIASAGCASNGTHAPVVPVPIPVPATSAPIGGTHVFKHIVIAIQENRSFDNVYAGAVQAGLMTSRPVDVALYGYGTTCRNALKVSTCNQIALTARGFESPYDPNHSNAAILTECNVPTPSPAPAKGTSPCRMNGFQNETFSPSPPPTYTNVAYAYLPPAEIAPYVQLANTYGIADAFFSAARGPSFPGHVFLISGLGPADDPPNSPWGCGEPSGDTVPLFTAWTPKAQAVYPCFTYQTIAKQLNARGIAWKYYTGETPPDYWDGLVEPFAAFKGTKNTKHQVSRAEFFSDVASGGKKRCGLPAVAWITPNGNASDHAGFDNNADGPYWIGELYETIAQSPCYADTAFLVLWDDSGGWYDHVPPPYVLVSPPPGLLGYRDNVAGFRVPLIFIAPNAVAGVSHKPRDFGAVLAFVERNFGLHSLGGLDEDFGRDALGDMYVPKPSATITPIPQSQILLRGHDARYFLSQPPRPADDQ